MELIKYVKEYNYLKTKMETSVLMYGLCDSRTIKYSQELDLLLNKVMKIRYTGLKHFERNNGLSGGTEGENNKTTVIPGTPEPSSFLKNRIITMDHADI